MRQLRSPSSQLQAVLQDTWHCMLNGTHCTGFKELRTPKLLRYCELWCDPKNAVALHCAQCSVYLCRECDQRMHQGRRMSHTRSEPGSGRLSREQSPGQGGLAVEPPQVRQPAQSSFCMAVKSPWRMSKIQQ